ncbi:RusA family crossover junction endodeoxyribonuclease [Lactobacillus sp. 3B(2020)]|uniref:RusA family crossover junction endodeoxyribonuclease n=1 Tax=Lactobacillus sp. 3B(2020) TaxID=2695882 RepID=UPI0015DF9BC9|nr:RusA family crossover junction endodeoxyribonuclease [Lactobacillus sp. 3B(2020)]QLL69575.1 hypothetical protein GTO83_02975 [Lactobacillus sp. 3B(2020)]
MQKQYHLRFDLKPVQQARPRARRTKFGVQLYDPIKVKKFKQELGLLAKQQWQSTRGICDG